MLNFFIGAMLGWPAILGSVILALAGLFRREFRFLVAAAVLALPFSWALSGFPVIQSPVFLLPLIPFLSAYFMYRDREMLAWIFAVPYFLMIWLLLNVIHAV
ncbi:MAG: hypothetical protein IT310_03325 [Anaerolineales bacterium]|nr:hypothetical protein [Anaerolineales bacterium]